MTKLRSWYVRGLIAAVALTVVLAVWVLVTPSSEAAIVVGPGVWIYYSSATYTTVVGARGNGCCGSVINWGVTTQWKRFERIYCTMQVCPD